MRIRIDYIGAARHALQEAHIFTRERRTRRKLTGLEIHELNQQLRDAINALCGEVDRLGHRVAELERERDELLVDEGHWS